MGIVNDFDGESAFDTQARISFEAKGETDGGLSFGTSLRADEAAGAEAGFDGVVYAAGSFGKLSMGDVESATEAAIGHAGKIPDQSRRYE